MVPTAGRTPQTRYRGALARRSSAALVGAALVGASALAAFPVVAQERPGSGPEVEEPAMPEAPELFRIGAVGHWVQWPAPDEGVNEVDDHAAAGVELEAVVSRWVAFRLGLTLGGTEIRSPSGDRIDARHVGVEVLAAPRVALDALQRAGVTPWAEVGVGSLVHDPDADSLATRNQNALVLGGGVDWDFARSLGVRAGWRRTRVELADVFDPEDRGSTDVWTNRVVVLLYWRL